jgi:Na+-driven multidrug efflux pump
MLAQGIESHFGLITICCAVFGGGIAIFLSLFRKMGMTGWIIGRAAFDLVNIIMILIMYFGNVKVKNLSMVNLKNSRTGLGRFLSDVFRFTLVLYSEFLGWEISTLLMVMTKDKNQIAAFSSIVNLAYIVWNIGNGFSNTARTRINYLLGQKKGRAAKNFFTIVLLGMIIFAMTIGVAFYFGREAIGRVYASENLEIRYHVVSLLQIYGFLTIGDFLFAYMFTITRSTNQVLYNMFLDYVFLIGIHAAVSYYIVKFMNGNCRTVLMCVEGSLFVVYIGLFIKLFSMDWNAIEFKDEEGSPDIEDGHHTISGQETSFSHESREPLKAKN